MRTVGILMWIMWLFAAINFTLLGGPALGSVAAVVAGILTVIYLTLRTRKQRHEELLSRGML